MIEFSDKPSGFTRMTDKECNRRLQTIFEDPICNDILKRFGYSVFHRSSVVHSGFTEFFRDMYVGDAKNQTALEIGSFNGLTSYFMSHFFKKVITCDIVDQKEKYDLWKTRDNIEFVLITEENKQQKLEHYDYQFVYLDGDHRKPDVDFQLFGKCGRGLVHEAWDDSPANFDMVGRVHGAKFFGFNFAYFGPDEKKRKK